ncbi:MAG TPA: aminoacyl-tRNA hydrolase [Candidatus Omnitrophota bacterium]|nr:aminoacyl-tRNA hydrolase [Candidatus Omnitrophota bacterium]HPS37117.1 aminoacyl-tRNA hydrolase [Candidatus Omnitrophota bacterium]
MKLIVGLGNPGEEYSGTRHNIGRRLVEFIAAKESVSFSSKKSLKASVASCSWDGQNIQLVYPLTYMNLSGEAVAKLSAYFKVPYRDILIIVDDVALPFGRLRLRGEGSSGGHNGLGSIEEHLGSREYSRLRMGIGIRDEKVPEGGAEAAGPLREYVLSRFSSTEEKKMGKLLEKAEEACRSWALEPLAKAMSHVNGADL